MAYHDCCEPKPLTRLHRKKSTIWALDVNQKYLKKISTNPYSKNTIVKAKSKLGVSIMNRVSEEIYYSLFLRKNRKERTPKTPQELIEYVGFFVRDFSFIDDLKNMTKQLLLVNNYIVSGDIVKLRRLIISFFKRHIKASWHVGTRAHTKRICLKRGIYLSDGTPSNTKRKYLKVQSLRWKKNKKKRGTSAPRPLLPKIKKSI